VNAPRIGEGCPVCKPTADCGGKCWPTIKPSKGWPFATHLRRAKGLHRARCSAFVSHQAFDAKGWSGITIHLHRDDLHKLPDTPRRRASNGLMTVY
jgi:hypothetical protein